MFRLLCGLIALFVVGALHAQMGFNHIHPVEGEANAFTIDIEYAASSVTGVRDSLPFGFEYAGGDTFCLRYYGYDWIEVQLFELGSAYLKLFALGTLWDPAFDLIENDLSMYMPLAYEHLAESAQRSAYDRWFLDVNGPTYLGLVVINKIDPFSSSDRAYGWMQINHQDGVMELGYHAIEYSTTGLYVGTAYRGDYFDSMNNPDPPPSVSVPEVGTLPGVLVLFVLCVGMRRIRGFR